LLAVPIQVIHDMFHTLRENCFLNGARAIDATKRFEVS